jgi:hypothetical protein
MATHGLTTTFRIGLIPTPTQAPKPIGTCNHCDTEYFDTDLTSVSLLIPVRDHTRTAHHRKSHRLHQSNAVLCTKCYTHHLAQKEF